MSDETDKSFERIKAAIQIVRDLAATEPFYDLDYCIYCGKDEGDGHNSKCLYARAVALVGK